MTIDFGEANEQKTPEGYEECHAIIGFDSEGKLRISETDNEWEPDECERSFFVGNVQRVVFYHKVESRPSARTQYFIMDNHSQEIRQFQHYNVIWKKAEQQKGTLVEKLPDALPDEELDGAGPYTGPLPILKPYTKHGDGHEYCLPAPGNTEPAMGYAFYNGAPTCPPFPTSDYILEKESEPQKKKTADSLLSEILKKPMKTIFDKD